MTRAGWLTSTGRPAIVLALAAVVVLTAIEMHAHVHGVSDPFGQHTAPSLAVSAQLAQATLSASWPASALPALMVVTTLRIERRRPQAHVHPAGHEERAPPHNSVANRFAPA